MCSPQAAAGHLEKVGEVAADKRDKYKQIRTPSSDQVLVGWEGFLEDS